MLQGSLVIAVALGYIGLLFVVASYGDRARPCARPPDGRRTPPPAPARGGGGGGGWPPAARSPPLPVVCAAMPASVGVAVGRPPHRCHRAPGRPDAGDRDRIDRQARRFR